MSILSYQKGGGFIDILQYLYQANRVKKGYDLGMRIYYVFYLFCFIFCLTACQRSPQVEFKTQSGSTVSFDVDIANTDASREQGLQYRDALAPNAGMLFIFPAEHSVAFWMKNTSLPLDMIFINTDLKVVGIVPNTTPFSLAPLSVAHPSRYVLEINAGLAQSAGIHTGDQVRYIHVDTSNH